MAPLTKHEHCLPCGKCLRLSTQHLNPFLICYQNPDALVGIYSATYMLSQRPLSLRAARGTVLASNVHRSLVGCMSLLGRLQQSAQTGWLNNRNVLSHSSGGQKFGIKIRFLPRALKDGPVSGISPWFIDGSLPVHTVFSQYACLCFSISLFHKDTCHIGLGLILMTQCYLSYLCKHPVSNKVTCLFLAGESQAVVAGWVAIHWGNVGFLGSFCFPHKRGQPWCAILPLSLLSVFYDASVAGAAQPYGDNEGKTKRPKEWNQY